MDVGRLGAAGPAQFDWLIHFCGRPPGTGSSPHVPPDIKGLTPPQRLCRLLWEQQIRGFRQFGTEPAMVCFSESPLDHMKWLIKERLWPPWGVLLQRQVVYDLGGGPVWYVRTEQRAKLPEEIRGWAVRLDAGPCRSDWLHEREWRIPLSPCSEALMIPDNPRPTILIGDPSWLPSSADRQLPHLWKIAHRGYWDSHTQDFVPLTSLDELGRLCVRTVGRWVVE
jgi:hypothetical protein